MSRYLVRLAEQVGATALGGFLAAWAASGNDLSRAALGAAVAGGLRAVYGMIVQPVGDKESPSAVK
ncbi:hypothetical protein [Streptomyces sp. SID13726]|uniref:hypothetical protein n=1 Tax=Streptomyces sp. SID13726 TaxID=2706058 RepID=UPI0013B85F8A|nr:hypothetical protein [Streptomyces sp. SID13726]NEB04501.1 hypothetical protein [Streptomyces sp. SID13726]